MSVPVFFSTGDTAVTFSIPIVNDDVFEPNEDFSLTLVIPKSTQEMGVITGAPFKANVIIEDNDSEY